MVRRTLFVVALALVIDASGCRREQATTLTSARVSLEPSLATRMRGHDAYGTAMRDAIVHGDVDEARRQAKALADLHVAGSVVPSLRDRLDAMNIAAANVLEASNPHDASRAVAGVARTCGECHATFGGPAIAADEPPSEGASYVHLRMQRHRWAADRLWDGLVAPSERAWRSGARVLEDAPLEPPAPLTPEEVPIAMLDVLVLAVHDLGRRASVAESTLDRSAIYGELLSTCSTCHARFAEP